MDLVQTVRKEGSRGGRDFKWSDVESSSHRQNYLGHSIMAPTGRWAKGRDLTWYAKGDKDDLESEANARKEEIRRVKEAESDAMALALGLPVPERSNPNNEALGTKKDVERALNDSVTGEQSSAGGIGYGRAAKSASENPAAHDVDRIEGNAEHQDKELAYALREYQRRHRSDANNGTELNRDRSRDRARKHYRRRSRDSAYRRRSRSRDRESRRHSSRKDQKADRRRSHSPRSDRRHDRRNDHTDRS